MGFILLIRGCYCIRVCGSYFSLPVLPHKDVGCEEGGRAARLVVVEVGGWWLVEKLLMLLMWGAAFLGRRWCLPQNF